MKTVRQGDWGDDIKSLQEILASLGYSVEINSLFDVATKDAVMAFQNTYFDETGVPLVVDGIVGPKTWWALTHAKLSWPSETTTIPNGGNKNKTLFLLLGLGILILFLVGE